MIKYDKLLNAGLVADDYETIRVQAMDMQELHSFALTLTDWENESLKVIMRPDAMRELRNALSDALRAVGEPL